MSSTRKGPAENDPITAEQWRALSDRESDVVLRLDAKGVCQWATGAPWFGKALADVVVPEDANVVRILLGETAQGPLWIRRPEPTGGTTWVHAVSVPGAESGWVVQIRDHHQVDRHQLAESIGLDGITGVAGREHALNEVAFLLSATPRTGKEVAVACCGLDRLSAVNASLGTEAGDEVMRVAAGRITDALRAGDLVARLDSDRFLVVLRGVHHLRGAIRVANKIRAVVEDPIPLPTGEINQTMSVGVTIISRGESVDSVLERAEGALAMAKDAGRNLVMSSPPI
jgi:diguanylate cyclase (GGDEF)-like protein